MQTFYKDKTSLFEAKISVDGADLSNTKARLVLKLPNNKNFLYYGSLKEDVCSFEIPALKEVKDNQGELVLEVIAENTFFESFTDNFELKQSKSVKVEVVSKNKEIERPKVLVETKIKQENNIQESIEKKVVQKKVKPQLTKDQLSTKLISLFKESKEKKLIKKEDLNTHLPSKTAMIISDSLSKLIESKDKQYFQLFLDKFDTNKLSKIKKILS